MGDMRGSGVVGGGVSSAAEEGDERERDAGLDAMPGTRFVVDNEMVDVGAGRRGIGGGTLVLVPVALAGLLRGKAGLFVGRGYRPRALSSLGSSPSELELDWFTT